MKFKEYIRLLKKTFKGRENETCYVLADCKFKPLHVDYLKFALAFDNIPKVKVSAKTPRILN